MAQQDKQSNRNSEYINPYEVTPNKPFHIAFLREITDQYDAGEISYGKMVELLNEVAMKWHEQLLIEAMLSEHMFDDSEYANRRYKYWQEVKQNK